MREKIDNYLVEEFTFKKAQNCKLVGFKQLDSLNPPYNADTRSRCHLCIFYMSQLAPCAELLVFSGSYFWNLQLIFYSDDQILIVVSTKNSGTLTSMSHIPGSCPFSEPSIGYERNGLCISTFSRDSVHLKIETNDTNLCKKKTYEVNK